MSARYENESGKSPIPPPPLAKSIGDSLRVDSPLRLFVGELKSKAIRRKGVW